MSTIDMNLKLMAATQYLNTSFNSYANFNGMKIAASTEGICKICGTTDNGISIDAYFSPVISDLGIKNPKRLRYVYIGFQSDEDMLLEVFVDDGTIRSYTIPANSNGQQRVRITIDKDKKGRYWNFKIKNVNGNDFAIDNSQVLPIILNEGFK